MEDTKILQNLRSYKQFTTNIVTDEILQYAAGFSDTDGCFQVFWKRNLKFYIGQAEKGIAALHFMYDIFGGKITLHKKGNERHQTSYDWILLDDDAIKYSNAIKPFLLIKLREAIVMLYIPKVLLKIKIFINMLSYGHQNFINN